jgi:hypothetical protein
MGARMTRQASPNSFGRSSGRPAGGLLTTLAALALGALCVQSCGEKQSLVIVSLTASPADATLKTVVVDVASVSKTFPLTAGLTDTAISFGVYVPSSLTGDSILVAASAKNAAGEGCYQGQVTTKISAAGVTANAAVVLMPKKSCSSSMGTAGMGAAGAQGTAGAGGTAGTQGAAGAQGSAGTMGTAGTGTAGMGTAGMGTAGMGTAGMGTAGMGTAGMGTAGMGTAGMGTAGMGTAGMGTAGMGTAGTGMVVGPPSLAKCTEYSHIDALSCNANSVNGGTVHVWDVAISPSGSLLATAGDDGRVKIWKMTGAVPSAEGHVLLTSDQAYVAFSPDGKWFVEGSTFGELKLFDATTFTVQGNLDGHSDDIEGLAFTPDSKHIWSLDYSGTLTRHDIGAGAAAVASITVRGFGYTLGLSPVASAGFQWIALGYDDGTGDIANVALSMTTPTPINVTADGTGVYGMSFSPDGLTLAAGGVDGVVSFWAIPPAAGGAASGATITVPDGVGTPEPVRTVRYSPDGKSLALATGDPSGAWKLSIWDATTRKVRVSKVPTFPPLSAAWSPSGTILVSGEDACGKFIVCSDN